MNYIRTIQDFPKPGIGFKDITTLLKEPAAFREAIARLTAHFSKKGIQKVVGIESRGFIFGAPLALNLQAGFVPARKPKTARLVEKLGGQVAGLAFLIELDFLQGRRRLEKYEVHSLIHVTAE
jgi:adenine phosphoribosyltransferase